MGLDVCSNPLSLYIEQLDVRYCFYSALYSTTCALDAVTLDYELKAHVTHLSPFIPVRLPPAQPNRYSLIQVCVLHAAL